MTPSPVFPCSSLQVLPRKPNLTRRAQRGWTREISRTSLLNCGGTFAVRPLGNSRRCSVVSVPSDVRCYPVPDRRAEARTSCSLTGGVVPGDARSVIAVRASTDHWHVWLHVQAGA